jgi:hypothetical protein
MADTSTTSTGRREPNESRGPRPLFLVGMPRSGTKLLRSVLNNHPAIAIATSETEFLPNWIRGWSHWGDINRKERFHAFFLWNLSFPFFQNQRRKGALIDEGRWFHACRSFDLAEVFYQLIRHHIGDKPDLAYWGDKSPGYTFWIDELNHAFPEARFVHIVRDPRDYAASMRQAWGRNVSRAAQQWKEGTLHVQQAAAGQAIRLFTVHFEDLLKSPADTIQRLCTFLQIDYRAQMLEVGRVESVGDAAGRTGIVADNASKFDSKLSALDIKRIESICGQHMRSFGYEPRFEPGDADLPRWRLGIIRLFDSCNVVLHNARRRGWAYGLKHAILFRWMRIRAGSRRNRQGP